jgi:formate-dependent nitrite reductase membrane component NrfD
MAHGAVSALWLLSSWLGQEFVLRLLAWPAVLVALATAGYTALLFGQCEGRDLWQSPLVLWHLLLQAALAGAGALLLPAVLSGSGRGMVGTLAGVLTCAVALNGLLLAGENLSKPTNRDVALAGEMIWRGRYAPAFVCGAFGLSVVLPILVLVGFQAWTGASPGVAAAAAVMVLVGLLIHEVIFVKAGQAVPLS